MIKIIAMFNDPYDISSGSAMIRDIAEFAEEAQRLNRNVRHLRPFADFEYGVAVVFEGEATDDELRTAILEG